MSYETIQRRTAAVRKSWSYGERLQRVVAAQQRCSQLLAELGLTKPRQMAYARQQMPSFCNRVSG